MAGKKKGRKKYSPKNRKARYDYRAGGSVRARYLEGNQVKPLENIGSKDGNLKDIPADVSEPTGTGYRTTPRQFNVAPQDAPNVAGQAFQPTPWGDGDEQAFKDASKIAKAEGEQARTGMIDHLKDKVNDRDQSTTNTPPSYDGEYDGQQVGNWIWSAADGAWQPAGGNNTGDNDTTSDTRGAEDPNRDARVIETGQRAVDIAAGRQSPDLPQVPVPKQIGRQGTEIDIEDARYRATGPAGTAQADTVGTSTETVQTDTAATGTLAPERAARTYQAETVADRDVGIDAATMEGRGVAPVQEQTLTDTRDSAAINRTLAEIDKAKNVDALISAGAFVPEVLGLSLIHI